jgi:AraC family transcriptional regulator of adaptative response/methylated-DNA-[protein]-cysteine methyltransferase
MKNGLALGGTRASSGEKPQGRLWRAVVERDAASDGRFVFAVTSTGIYCRPSCPARRPRRDHVRLFSAPPRAEEAGFRPCRRCRPRQTGVRLERVKAACRAIDESGGERLRLEDLARTAGLSPGHFQRVFKALVGVTPRAYADARRLGALKTRLREGDMVTGSLYEVGYGSSSRLYEGSKDRLGMTPATYRRGGRGMRIDYACVGSPLGRVLVASTERGIAAVYMGDKDAPLVKALGEEFPHAEIRKDAGGLGPALKAVLLRLSGKTPQPDLPLDIRATAFQRRVWDALLRIPRGETRSYAQLARELGVPEGARAVARACATNRLAVVIPCHRVVGGDGALRGYRWGVERKKALLTLEGARPRGGEKESR